MKNYVCIAAAFSLAALSCGKKVEEPARIQQTTTASAPTAPDKTAAKAEPAPEPSAAPALSAAPIDPALLKPEAATATAPAKFKTKFSTTKGDFVVEVTRAWAPVGADRFYNLVKLGFFEDIAFFRVVPGFVVQFGIHGEPAVAKAWKSATIKDDKNSSHSNEKGTLTFAKAGPNTRTTQFFINLSDNPRLDEMGFPPIGKVVQGMDVVEAINKEYGERPDQSMIQASGNAYVRNVFPRLDYVTSATLLK